MRKRFTFYQDFIETLEEKMIKRLCIHSRWGVGSMDFIHDLLISEDDLDDDDNADCFANQ